MNLENLTLYLRDHLAGSVAALQLLDHLITTYGARPEAEQILTLKAEVEADQQQLKNLLDRLGQSEGTLKKAGAWMAEKALQAKVNSGDDELGLLEALEVLILGIEGKLRLWRSLECLDTGLELPSLQLTATSQIHRVETLHMEAAKRAFLTSRQQPRPD